MDDVEIDRRIDELRKTKNSLIETTRMYQDIMYMNSLDEPGEGTEYDVDVWQADIAKLLFYVLVMILAFTR